MRRGSHLTPPLQSAMGGLGGRARTLTARSNQVDGHDCSSVSVLERKCGGVGGGSFCSSTTSHKPGVEMAGGRVGRQGNGPGTFFMCWGRFPMDYRGVSCKNKLSPPWDCNRASA